MLIIYIEEREDTDWMVRGEYRAAEILNDDDEVGDFTLDSISRIRTNENRKAWARERGACRRQAHTRARWGKQEKDLVSVPHLNPCKVPQCHNTIRAKGHKRKSSLKRFKGGSVRSPLNSAF